MEGFTKNLFQHAYHSRCVGSSHGWLACFNGLRCSFYLANTLSPSPSPEIIELPSVETLPNIRGVVRDAPDKVKVYQLYWYRNNTTYEDIPYTMNWLYIRRFAMSSPPDNGCKQGCTVMVSYSNAHVLAFCKIGDTSWTHLNSRFKTFVEIIYSKKRQIFYALTYSGMLEGWDLRCPTKPKRIDTGFNLFSYQDPFIEETTANEPYLVESSGGDILYVVRYYVFVAEDGSYENPDLYHPVNEDVKMPSKTIRFDIFKLDFEKEVAEPLTSIVDRALFVGYNHSFSLSANDYSALKPNSIYFGDVHDNSLYHSGYSYRGYDSGVYNLEDHTVTPLHHPLKFGNLLPAPTWVFPWQ